MSDLSKEQKWRERIDTCVNSGMNIEQWCKLNHVSSYQYHYWKKKFKQVDNPKNDAVTEWVPLIIDSLQPSSPKDTPIILSIGAYKLELSQGFNKQVLTDVIQVLGDLC